MGAMSSRVRTVIKTIFRVLLAIAMVLSGVFHFATPEPALTMRPDYRPAHRALVYVSGLAELILGVAVLVPKLRPWAGWGIVALLVAVWPANIWMATSGVQPPGLEMSPTAAWIRVALQPALMLWAWAVSRPDPDQTPESSALK
jgi:uncharacterized membrane protein